MSQKHEIPRELLNPDKYLIPSIHLSPFNGQISYCNNTTKIDISTLMDKASESLFNEKKWGTITKSGRHAISLALEAADVKKNDLLSIITTSNCGYVSACVTEQISKHCQYQFGYNQNADIFFLIHEFGRQAKLPAEMKKKSSIVIEDCAYALTHKNFKNGFGSNSDYQIFSLTKAFNMQYGGLIFGPKDQINKIGKEYTSPYLEFYLEKNMSVLERLNKKRLAIYKKMQSVSKSYGFEEILKATSHEVPSAFLIKIEPDVNHNFIKSYMNSHGIESSVFYGGAGYFLPCHQNLTPWHIDYIFYHMQIALKQQPYIEYNQTSC